MIVYDPHEIVKFNRMTSLLEKLGVTTLGTRAWMAGSLHYRYEDWIKAHVDQWESQSS